MRWEKPWSASVGAQKKISAIESVEQDGRERARGDRAPCGKGASHAANGSPAAQTSATTYSNDRPGEQHEDRVIEHEEPVGCSRRRRRRRSGSPSGRKSSGRSSSRARPATAIAPKSVPTAAMPMSASATAATVRPSTAEKKAREGRQRDELGADEEREHRERLREPDRAPVARREHERVEQALLALGDEGPRQAEQRGEDDRRPEQAERSVVAGAARQREVEDRQRRDHEQQHRRAASPSPAARAAGPCASARRRRRSRSCERQPRGREALDALRLVGRDDDRRPRLGEHAVEQRGRRRRRAR